MTKERIIRALREKIEADQKDEILNHQVHEAIGKVLESFVGKKLTKRFTDKVTAAIVPLFQSRPIVFYPNPGELVIWGERSPGGIYDERRLAEDLAAIVARSAAMPKAVLERTAALLEWKN